MIIYVVLALVGLLVYLKQKKNSRDDFASLASYYGDHCWTAEDEVFDSEVHPFKIEIESAQLDDFRTRIENTRFSMPSLKDTGFTYGVNSEFMQDVVKYWRDSFDWRKQEEELNRFPNFKTKIEGLDIHFVHIKPVSSKNQVKPLMMVHGWPGSFYEFYKIIPMLTNPTLYGGNETDAFEVVVPSIPGFGFSQSAGVKGLGSLHCARIFHKLMLRLGHKEYYLQGGDFGSYITTHLSRLYPNAVKGLHLNFNTTSFPPLLMLKILVGSFAPSLFFDRETANKLYPLKSMVLEQLLETGYSHIQATKPDTIGYSLSDSPVGLAAYILEKFSTATDPNGREKNDGDILKYWNYDELLTNIMIYWWNGNITSTMRLYKESLADHAPTSKIKVRVPVGYASMPNELAPCIRGQLEATYKRLLSFTRISEGGHFAAFQVPHLLVEDIRNFVRLAENEKARQSFREAECRQQFKQTHLDRVSQ